MSYDFWVEVDTGGHEPMMAEPFFNDLHPALASDGIAGTCVLSGSGELKGYSRCGNYTSNVSPIWHRCLSAASSVQGAWPTPADLPLAKLAGHECGDLVPLLAVAVSWGVEHLEELSELNPGNGWGDAAGALTYLWDIQRMCEAHPRATLGLSY